MSENRTPAEAKTWLRNQGYTYASWAKANGFDKDNVRKVLDGKSKMIYGEGRQIAIKLNIAVPQ